MQVAKEAGAILTVEEHSVYGGLGSTVSELCSKKFPIPMDMMGFAEFAESGDYGELLKKYGLSAEHIRQKAKNLVERKRKG